MEGMSFVNWGGLEGLKRVKPPYLIDCTNKPYKLSTNNIINSIYFVYKVCPERNLVSELPTSTRVAAVDSGCEVAM